MMGSTISQPETVKFISPLRVPYIAVSHTNYLPLQNHWRANLRAFWASVLSEMRGIAARNVLIEDHSHVNIMVHARP